ncbi:MAG: response regulator [Pseudomonadota bacterium]
MSGTILICDDEAPLRRLLKDHLSETGYDVVEAADADALRARLGEVSPDLIILDIRMPGTDGLTALRELRQSSQIPVMMLRSGETSPNRARNASASAASTTS